MKARNLMGILIVALMMPAVASAQIVIERLNEDIDPSAPIVKPDPEAEAPVAEEEEELEVEEVFSDDEKKAMHKVFLKQLQAAHTKCLRTKVVQRPKLASITGSATWSIASDGRAKFSEGSSSPTPEMFFASTKEFETLKPAERRGAQDRATEFYTGCLELKGEKVAVTGKDGDFTVSYTVKWSKNAAVVELAKTGDDSEDES